MGPDVVPQEHGLRKKAEVALDAKNARDAPPGAPGTRDHAHSETRIKQNITVYRRVAAPGEPHE